MTRFKILLLAGALLITTGCAERMANTTSTSPSVPSGPTVADTSSRGVIPSGTEMVIRTNERIEARDVSSSGRDYDAEVARDVVNERGDVLVPAGSRARMRVYRANNNNDEMVLGLHSLTINGRTHEVYTSDVPAGGSSDIGMNRETAKHVGGGALLGTLVGAIAGGAKGAAVGAAVGAAGGAAVQVMTRGRQVDVPAETLLTFRLDSPIELRGLR